ncbi:signal peptidase I [Plantactinospora sp. CA-290183]|uniref:signal peptidase I n=1 Tax=Plantactinospora sp. CA-290183 TaxID=3240006 RepID=UPI003D8D188C
MVRRVDEASDVEPWRRRTRRSRRTRRQMPLWQELPLLLIVAFCLAVLIRTFLLQAFFIPSGSMEDTLLIGDRVLVNKIVYDLRDPVRGEIVVFRGTADWAPQLSDEPEPGFVGKLGRTIGDLVGVSRPGDKDFIKRVIGLPGDRVRCCDDQGRVTVNGAPLDEPYVLENSPLEPPPNRQECRSRRFDEVVVPPGQLFVMGDHRLVSQDGRCQGPVPIDNVIGRAFVIVWPSTHWTSLPVPETFDNLPKPVAAAGLGTPSSVPGSPENPENAGAITANTGDAAITLPIMGTLLITARSRRSSGTRHRRLHS